MPLQEIPQREWKAFCDSFSHQHQGWLVSLEVPGTDLGVVHCQTSFARFVVTTLVVFLGN